MITLVVDDYPAERLPLDLRGQIDPGARVRVTVDVTGPPFERPPFKPKRLRDYIGAGKGVYGSPEEAVAAIRALRDEWD